MKIRWNANSLRLRITPAELAALLRGEDAGQALSLTRTLAWAVTVRPSAPLTALICEGQNVVITLSLADLESLARPDAEGVYFGADTPGGPRYYIEKDFPCTHPRADEAAEIEAETFPGPAAAVEFEMSRD